MTHRKTNGFTLVELMLSMAFISILLLFIAMLVLQIGSIYNKGLTLRSVNEAGQFISSDIQRSLSTSNPLDVKTVTQSTGGRICLGTTVYAWNKANQIINGENGLGALNQYRDGRHDPVRLVKFVSDGPDYCAQASDRYPEMPNTGVTELLGSGDTNLAIHELTITHDDVEGDASQQMYKAEMFIGTAGEKEISEPNHACVVPDTLVDDEYCAVNRFEFIARAGNKGVE